MKDTFVALLLAACVVGILIPVSAVYAAGHDSVSIPALMQKLESADDATRMGAADALSEVGADAIAPLFDVMGGENRTTDLAARIAVQRMVHHAAAPKSNMDRAAIAQALAQQASSNRPAIVRTFAIRMLSYIGGDAEVPALARLLTDPQVGEISRYALTRIPGPASLAALEAALPSATGDMRIGIINALGARRDANALPALGTAAKSDDPAERAAALQAMARIPDQRCAVIVRASIEHGPAADKAAAWDAYIKLGETLLAAGKRADAENVYRFAYSNGSDEQLRCAGLAGLGKVGSSGAVKTLLDALFTRLGVVQSGSHVAFSAIAARDLRGAAFDALVAAPGAQTTDAIGDRMLASRGSDKLVLVQILGRRGGPAAVKALATASSDGAEAVRLSAAQALGETGEASAVSPLVARLKDPSEAVRDAAELSLIQLRGKGVTAAEIKAIAAAPGTVRVTLLQALGNRKDPAAMPALLAALNDKSKPARLAALEGIAVSARQTDAAARVRLVEVLRAGDRDERQAALSALSRVPVSMIGSGEKAQFVRLEANAPAPMRASLLGTMASWNDPSLMDLFAKAAADPNQEVAVAGLTGLTPLLAQPIEPAKSASIQAELLGIAQKSSGATRAAALEGYLSLADQRRGSDAAGALAMYHNALGLAQDDENRRTALRGVAAIGSVDSLPYVERFLDQGGAMGEAAVAAVAIAGKVAQAGDKDKAIDLYRRAIRATSDRGLIEAAVRHLRSLGVDIDIAAEAGFVSHWWVLGPFPGRKQMTERDVIATDAPVDVAAPVVVDGKTFNWKHVQVADAVGMLDLREAVAPQEDCAAYAYAEVTSDADRDVIFKIGSDDAVVCWLNGKHIHSYMEDRGYAPDQDIVPTHLRAGMNFILMKVLNGGADWACGLRITDTDNRPLRLPQRKS
jgi:HEAT repeat protein